MRGQVRRQQGQQGARSDWEGGGTAISGILIVMQQMNPAARWVEGAFYDDCFVGLDHAVLLPFVLAHCKNTPNSTGIVKAEGSKFECVEKRLLNISDMLL